MASLNAEMVPRRHYSKPCETHFIRVGAMATEHGRVHLTDDSSNTVMNRRYRLSMFYEDREERLSFEPINLK